MTNETNRVSVKTINLAELGRLQVKAQKMLRTIDPLDYPEETIFYWMSYGIKRGFQDRINSAAHALKGSVNRELTEKEVTDIFDATDEMFMQASMGQRGAGSSIGAVDPVTALALKSAKVLLLDVFKARTGASKITDMLGDEKVLPYFNKTESGASWNDAKVLEFIEKQKESGGRDFMAEAENAQSDLEI